MTSAKPFVIPKRLVWEAYQRVKANRGAAGIDGQSIEDFDRDQSRNLYRIWNRMSSGSYMPPAVKAVPIPKKSGGERILGVPTVSDRIAQTAVTLVLEPILEPVFHDDSYGYRPGKSAHDALAVTRKRCWERDWVLEYDIRGLLDRCSYYPLADLGSSKRSGMASGSFIFSPLRLPCDTWMASSSPRLTRCNTVWRDTPRMRMASTIGT